MPTSQGGPRPQTPPTRVRPRISLPAQSTLIRGSAAAIATAIAVASDAPVRSTTARFISWRKSNASYANTFLSQARRNANTLHCELWGGIGDVSVGHGLFVRR